MASHAAGGQSHLCREHQQYDKSGARCAYHPGTKIGRSPSPLITLNLGSTRVRFRARNGNLTTTRRAAGTMVLGPAGTILRLAQCNHGHGSAGGGRALTPFGADRGAVGWGAPYAGNVANSAEISIPPVRGRRTLSGSPISVRARASIQTAVRAL